MSASLAALPVAAPTTNLATLAERPWLRPLGLLFGAAAAARVALYRRGALRQTRLRGPVVSIGNLSVGGTGKTPVVAHVARLLLEQGRPVAVLSRGYGGTFRGDALIVSDGRALLASAHEAGDEPVMLARLLPEAVVAVGARRDVVGREVERRFGPRVCLLDDGFQHLRLARDLDLLCVDACDESALPLPAGRLREFAGAATRADLVLLTQADLAPESRLRALEARHGAARTLRVTRQFEGFTDVAGRALAAPARAFLLSGIARPERFEADVAGLGVVVVGQARFRDHHRYLEAQLADVRARALAAGADALVTTAKDAVRLPQSGWQPPLVVLGLRARIDDQGRLLAALQGVLGAP